MHTISQDIPAGRTRRTYSTSFKSELIEQCRQVGVSCSAVAISHGLNPNVLRRWIKDAADSSDAVSAMLADSSAICKQALAADRGHKPLCPPTGRSARDFVKFLARKRIVNRQIDLLTSSRRGANHGR